MSKKNSKKLYPHGSKQPLEVLGTFSARSLHSTSQHLEPANYNARFIPDFATFAETLRRFEFGGEQRKAFTELKRRLPSPKILGYLDNDAKTLIAADASPVVQMQVRVHVNLSFFPV